MHLRKLFVIMLVTLISFGGAAAFLKVRESDAKSEVQTLGNPIKVTITQLPSENGKIPVEIIRASARLSLPNLLDEHSCVVKNNTSKAIRVVVPLDSTG